MTEIHVRKVRETETGGTPTPFDEPFKVVMNSSHTGFVEWGNRHTIVKPKVFTGGEQTEMPVDRLSFTIKPNVTFSPTLQANETQEGGDQAE